MYIQGDSNLEYNTSGDCWGNHLEQKIQITYYSDSSSFPSDDFLTLMSLGIILFVLRGIPCQELVKAQIVEAAIAVKRLTNPHHTIT
jgi:hypothetical protein